MCQQFSYGTYSMAVTTLCLASMPHYAVRYYGATYRPSKHILLSAAAYFPPFWVMSPFDLLSAPAKVPICCTHTHTHTHDNNNMHPSISIRMLVRPLTLYKKQLLYLLPLMPMLCLSYLHTYVHTYMYISTYLPHGILIASGMH